MTQTLSREQIEWCQRILTALTEDAVMKPGDTFGLKQPEWKDRVDALCTMALSASSEYERGQRDAIAAAVKEVSGHLSRLDESLNEGLMTDAGLSSDDRKAMAAQLDCIEVVEKRLLEALRALVPGEWVAVPAGYVDLVRRLSELHLHDSNGGRENFVRSGHDTAVLVREARAMLAAKE